MGGRRHLILYDGECGLCNRLNRFVIAWDGRDRFRFAPLQGAIGRGWTARFGKNPDDLDTFRVVEAFESDAPRLLSRSDAALFVLRELGGAWRAAVVLRALPRRLRDAAYDAVARRRHRWFGRHDACPVPGREARAKFLEDA